ncbi:hypothetical protein H8356DRAFT_1279541 [Neocallimastix lanati (nom. inval.)]|nr:hypothetical protein H8356DRAFT_1279541 [Neocallimastix sp. JGI-2020a]
MDSIKYRLLLCLFFLLKNCLIFIYGANIGTEKQLIDSINKDNNLYIKSEVKIATNDTLVINKKSTSIHLYGDSTEYSHLYFLNNDHINLIYECDNIYIEKLIITGNINFKCKTVSIRDIVLNGYFISNYTITDNNNNDTLSSVSLSNSIFNLSTPHNGIEINDTNVTISQSEFYGNDQYGLYLLKYINKGEIKNTISIDRSHFDGNYHNNGILCTNSTVHIYNSQFYYCHGIEKMKGGGAISLEYTYNSIANIEFLNNFSEYYGGSILFKYHYDTNASSLVFKNSTSSISGNSFSFYSRDKDDTINIIYNVTQYGVYDKTSKINTDGTLFRNLNIENIYSKSNGALFYIKNPISNGPNIQIAHSTFKNIYQNNDLYSATIAYVTRGDILFNYLTYQEDNGILQFHNTNITDFTSKYPEPLFKIDFEKLDATLPYLFIGQTIVSNIYQDGAVVESDYANFYNIHSCYVDNSCNSFKEQISENFESSIFYLKSEAAVRMSNFNFDKVYGKNNPYIGSPSFSFNNIKFINNKAENFGGVLYSEVRNYGLGFINFENCSYENNTALLDKNNFVTNPTHLEFDENYNNEVIEIYSGDIIEKEYSCSFYDDFQNKFIFNTNINNSNIKDLVFYELSLVGKNDKTAPTKIFGHYKGYCRNSSCLFKDIRLIGNPGEYFLELKIVAFGYYNEFVDNTITMNVKILDCPKDLILQDKYKINIKACYKPTCIPDCVNNGRCVNDNVCDCSKSSYTGTSFDFLIIILIGLIFNFVYVIMMTADDLTSNYCIMLSLVQNLGFSLIFGSIMTKIFRIYYIFLVLKTASFKEKSYIKYIFLISLILFYLSTAILRYVSKSVTVKPLSTFKKEVYFESFSNSILFISILRLNVNNNEINSKK